MGANHTKPMSIEELEKMAVTIRCDIIKMIHEANAGHPGGSLSAADMVTALYFRMMRVDPKNPDWPDRDRFILSKGHACPVWYAALAERGFYDKSHLMTLRKPDSILQGHADMVKTLGIGVRDTFAESGPYLEIIDKYALTAPHIADAVGEVVTQRVTMGQGNAKTKACSMKRPWALQQPLQSWCSQLTYSPWMWYNWLVSPRKRSSGLG